MPIFDLRKSLIDGSTATRGGGRTNWLWILWICSSNNAILPSAAESAERRLITFENIGSLPCSPDLRVPSDCRLVAVQICAESFELMILWSSLFSIATDLTALRLFGNGMTRFFWSLKNLELRHVSFCIIGATSNLQAGNDAHKRQEYTSTEVQMTMLTPSYVRSIVLKKSKVVFTRTAEQMTVAEAKKSAQWFACYNPYTKEKEQSSLDLVRATSELEDEWQYIRQ